jgi:membrane protease YdiL (CAAX protease family)
VSDGGLVAGVFGVHVLIRFGGLWNPLWIPVSMMLMWPLPWLLSPRPARRLLGFRAPRAVGWFAWGALGAIGALGVCAAAAWVAFGAGESNWFVHHARALQEPLSRVPEGMSLLGRFAVVTGPALLFSPLGEEILFRGYLRSVLAARWGEVAAQWGQAIAFGLVHLAHYGMMPLQPVLIALWVPSMVGVGLVFGWVVRRSGSVWCAVAAHAVFNLALNAMVFWALPGVVTG